MRKQKPIKPQSSWVITSYSDIQNPGTDKEIDAGYIEFVHEETGIISCHEMDWLRGDRSYLGEDPPTLLEIWNNMLRKDTPGTIGFIYRRTKSDLNINWHVTRKRGCFKYVLVDMSKRPPQSLFESVISDYSQNKIDMASFLKMLDGTQDDCADRVDTILNIDEVRRTVKTERTGWIKA